MEERSKAESSLSMQPEPQTTATNSAFVDASPARDLGADSRGGKEAAAHSFQGEHSLGQQQRQAMTK
eukprot:2653763-Rhodomonas_salina.4